MKRLIALRNDDPRPILDALGELDAIIDRATERAKRLMRIADRDRAYRRKDPFIRQWKR